MKLIIVCVAFVTLVSAARQPKKPIAEYFSDFAGEEDIHLITGDDDRPPVTFQGDVMKAKTTSLKINKHGQGKFNYNFETENGINVAQIGKLKDPKTFVISGSYTYTGANGKRYRVRYTADEFGYHPVTELDDQPEIEIKPQPTLPPLPKQTFAPLTSFTNGNNFNSFNNQNKKDNAADDGYVLDSPYNRGQQGLNNPQTFGNGQGFNAVNSGNGFLTTGGTFDQSGNNGAPNDFNSGNTFGSFGSNGNGLSNGGLNGLNEGLNNGFTNGLSDGLYNDPNSRLGNSGFNNGLNTINGFAQFDRTGKILEQTDLVFNTNFVSVPVQKQADPNRLYLPATPTYLPPRKLIG